MSSPPPYERTIVVGDVHGCRAELEELLDRLALRPGRDRLVFVGDLMDRGPDPAGVVRLIRELGAEAVLGNHDEKHLRWRKHESKRAADPTYKNPMKMSDEVQAENQALDDDDLGFLAGLPLSLDLGDDWVAVHGGLAPGVPLSRQKRHNLLRLRFVDERGTMASVLTEADAGDGIDPWPLRWDGPQSVVYGHMVWDLERPRVDQPAPGVHCYGIDTGCCFGGHLTALILPERRLVQVRAHATYAELMTGGQGR